MTSIMLIYPFFIPTHDRSVFRFPPLGLAYIAASLREAGYTVHILDCTFLDRSTALAQAISQKADVIGIYCMVTMRDDCLWFARNLRNHCRMLIAGGPLPTCDPDPFLTDFDYIVHGEGEQTVTELIAASLQGNDVSQVKGIVYRQAQITAAAAPGDPIVSPVRPFNKDLDRIPFPARDLLPNADYIQLGKRKYGYSITTIMSTRGCPYECDFCSNVIFGGSYRERTPENVVDEIEQVLRLGYDRISFADDVFTLNRQRVMKICAEIHARELQFQWECLGRVDSMDYDTAVAMKNAGCKKIYFGIESGNDEILRVMNKKITTATARSAVEAAHLAGLEVGGFFILFYPGETDETVLETLHLANSLPLDYVGLTIPYPLPGTALHQRLKDRLKNIDHPENNIFFTHSLIYESDFSNAKIWFGLFKGSIQFRFKKMIGKKAPFLSKLLEKTTDVVFRAIH
jgi:anaerobic magnesium-protoporphyrin IX monomethyl ester cyclase